MEIENYFVDQWEADIRIEEGIKFAIINLSISDNPEILSNERKLIWEDVQRSYPKQSKYLRGSNYDPADENSIMFQLEGGISNVHKLRLEIEESENDIPDVDLLFNEDGIYWLTNDQSYIRITSSKEEHPPIIKNDLEITIRSYFDSGLINKSIINNSHLLYPLYLFEFTIAIQSINL